MRPPHAQRNRARQPVALDAVDGRHAVELHDAHRRQVALALACQAGEGAHDIGAALYGAHERQFLAAAVAVQHRVIGQQLAQDVHVAMLRGVDEGARQPDALAFFHGKARPRLAHAVAGARGQLAAACLGAAQRAGDLGERHIEHIVQQEGGALGCGQPFQRQHQRHRYVMRDLARGRTGIGLRVRQGLGQPGADIDLAAHARRFEHIQAQAGRDAREKRARIVQRGRIDLAPAQPGFLHDVLGLGPGAQHPVRQSVQVAPVRLEIVRARRIDRNGGGFTH